MQKSPDSLELAHDLGASQISKSKKLCPMVRKHNCCPVLERLNKQLMCISAVYSVQHPDIYTLLAFVDIRSHLNARLGVKRRQCSKISDGKQRCLLVLSALLPHHHCFHRIPFWSSNGTKTETLEPGLFVRLLPFWPCFLRRGPNWVSSPNRNFVT